MTLQELARLGLAMRESQRNYFRGRTNGELSVARDAERRFDLACKAILAEEQTGTLFDLRDDSDPRLAGRV